MDRNDAALQVKTVGRSRIPIEPKFNDRNELSAKTKEIMEPRTFRPCALAGSDHGGVTSSRHMLPANPSQIQAITHKLSRVKNCTKPLLKKPQIICGALVTRI